MLAQKNLIELTYIVHEPRELIKDLIRDPFFLLRTYDKILEKKCLIAKDGVITNNSILLFRGDVYFCHEPGSINYIFIDYRGFVIKILIRFENFFIENHTIRIKIYSGSGDRMIHYEDLRTFAEYIMNIFIDHFSEKYLIKPTFISLK